MDDVVPSLVPNGTQFTSSGTYQSEIIPYPIYNAGTDLDAHVQVFQKAIQANGERNDLDILNLFCFILKDAISKWGEIFMQSHPRCTFVKLKATY